MSTKTRYQAYELRTGYDLDTLYLDKPWSGYAASSVVEHITSEIASIPETKRTLRYTRLLPDSILEAGVAQHMDYLRFCGLWEVNLSRASRWAHPEYLHGAPRSERELDAERLRECARAVWSTEKIGDVHGVCARTVDRRIKAAGVDYRELKCASRRRILRAICWSARWHDGPCREVFDRYSRWSNSRMRNMLAECEVPAFEGMAESRNMILDT